MDIQARLDRAVLLLKQGRTHDAAAESRQVLTQDPNHAFALGILSTCNVAAKEYAPALDLAQRAVQSEPHDPWLMFVLARAQFFNKQIGQAKQTIHAGLEIDPEFASFWELQSEIAFFEERWEEALYAAEKGLEITPDDVDLVNLRTRALVQLKRTGEAEETVDFALNRAPEDPYSHANRGWVLIEQDRYDEAIESFREALRLNPNLEHARAGLKEAIKGKNWLYRGVLKYFLWMNKMQSGSRWGIIIGLYLASRVLRGLTKAGGFVGYIAAPLLALYVLFVYSTWIGKPVGDFFLRFHSLGKLALDDDERRGSSWVGGLLAAGAILMLTSFLLPTELLSLQSEAPIERTGGLKGTLFLLGMGCFIMLIPIGGLFSVEESSQSRRYLKWFAIGLAASGLLGMTIYPGLLVVFGLGVFAYGWVANYFISKDAKSF